MAFAPDKSKLLRLGFGLRKFSCNLGPASLEYVHSFVYLGVTFHDDHRKKYMNMDGDLKKMKEKIALQKPFFTEKSRCPIHISSLTLFASYIPAFTYGSPIFPIQPKIYSKLLNQLVHTALGTYDSSSLEKCCRFLGWSLPEHHLNTLLFSFASRILSSRHSPIRQFASNCLSHSPALPWVKRLREQAQLYNVTKLTAFDLQSLADLLDPPKLGHPQNLSFSLAVLSWQKQPPHPTLLQAPHDCRYTFKFTLSNFNPADRASLTCPMCSLSAPDTPSHLSKDCPHPDACQIRSDFIRSTSADLSTIPPLDLLADPWTPAAADVQLSSDTWVALSRAHARLWRARRQKYFQRVEATHQETTEE